MKTIILSSFLLINCLFFWGCNHKSNPEEEIVCDSIFDIFGDKKEGEFVGQFSEFRDGRIVFLDRKKEEYEIRTIVIKEGELLDSLKKFPEKYKGKLFSVEWEFIEDILPPSPIHPLGKDYSDWFVTKINHPKIKSKNIEENLVKSNEPQNTKNNYKKVGEIRGMIYGSTLSQLQEEIGCIDYNWENEKNNPDDDNCPGQRLQVNTGFNCFDYDFVVYKNFVLNSKDEVSDLLVVVKDWGKKWSKVTYVGIFDGDLDHREHCKE
jgi:hypothetical protein